MAAIWKPQSKETLKHWLDAIRDEASDKLSNWEIDFIESIANQLVYKDSLSQSQEETLEKIYVKYTS